MLYLVFSSLFAHRLVKVKLYVVPCIFQSISALVAACLYEVTKHPLYWFLCVSFSGKHPCIICVGVDMSHTP